MLDTRNILVLLLFGFTLSETHGTVILNDTFSDGNPTQGAEVHPDPDNIWGTSGGTRSESGGILTVSTNTNSAQYNQSVMFTEVLPDFNIFSQTVKISVTGFSQSGTGVNEMNGQNFRLGLMPTDNSPATNNGGDVHTGNLGSFYSQGNDGINLRINNNRSFLIQYKYNSDSWTDPNITATATVGSAGTTLSFDIVAFDLEFSSTTWKATLYGEDPEDVSVNSGTWSLPLDPETGEWGDEDNGWGNAALMMYSQNGNIGDGSTSFTMDSITAEIIPEPSRFLLMLAALGYCVARRKR